MPDQFADFSDSDLEPTAELPMLSAAASAAAGAPVAPGDDPLDADDTAELPLPFAVVAVAAGTAAPASRARDPAALAARSAALEAAQRELAASQAARTTLTTKLEQRDHELAQLHGDFGRQQQQIAELRDALRQLQQRHAAAQEQLSAARQEIVDHAPLVTAGAAAAEKMQRQRDEIESLTAYIAGSNERWKARDALVSSQAERIADLQRELEQRVDRQQSMQHTAHEASARVKELKTRLAEAISTLRARDRDVALLKREPVLLCLSGAPPGMYVIGAQPMTIGRGPECEIRVLDHSVSREHARLRRGNGRVTIEDCGSTNGVFVNSVRVDQRDLAHGDSVTIGDVQFSFVSEART